MATRFGEAFAKAEEATKISLPTGGKVLISVNDRDKYEAAELAQGFIDCGFEIIATKGTADLLSRERIPVQYTSKLNEGRPNVLDVITNNEVSIVVNTPNDKKGAADDSYIRKAVIKGRIPYMTTMAEAKACIAGLKAVQAGNSGVKSLQAFHKEIK
jgi:carbamoyl-phosphate synthase large subunit